MLKVSVIVPTYCSGPALERVVNSLARQSMPQDEFEVIFVDDGSPDNTMDRLTELSTRIPNVTALSIEHSGWPSRPRNIGLDHAAGEYVLFMDHDDELYPTALEAGFALAARNGADVLNGKETRTDQAKWAIDVYTRNIDNAVDRSDVHPILPTNPHKLFRREFLLQHGIRFPEGRRVLWEDVFFTVEAYRHARVISVLADTPFYHWVRDGDTASSSYGKDVHEYWYWVHQIFTFITAQLSQEPRQEQFRQLIVNQYRTRVLAVIGSSFFAQSEQEVRTALAFIRQIIDLVPEEFDQDLPKTLRARSYLLRRDHLSALRSVASVDVGTLGVSTVSTVEWARRKLRISSVTSWTTSDGTGLRLVQKDGRVLRDLPSDVADSLPEALVDVTDEVGLASTVIGVRSRRTKVVWMLPTQHQVEIVGEGPKAEVRVTATAELDIASAAAGKALSVGTWEVNARNDFLGTLNHRALRTVMSERLAARVKRDDVVAYRTNAGMLCIDVSSARTARTILRRLVELIRAGQYRQLMAAISRRYGRLTRRLAPRRPGAVG